MHLKDIPFKNEFVNSFPGDPSRLQTPRKTPGLLYSLSSPTPVIKPKLLGWSKNFARHLGLEDPPSKEDILILAGNQVSKTMNPYSACYGGHQFGHWAGQLGDGRAITLGEFKDKAKNTWEIQLKGAGPTAYSRTADGRAVLRSSVREYLMSEAMFHLGVPTTRALSLISTGEPILRDMFYNGNPQYEPGAIVARLAPSFLRFGSYQLLAQRGEKKNLLKLIHWTINRYFPNIPDNELKIGLWFQEVCKRTALMIVHWHRVGFVHGVMNTDNMSILGLTVDYGPFSMMDEYDPAFTPNTSDLPGKRYAFMNQPEIALWNLEQLAIAINQVFTDITPLQTGLDTYQNTFNSHYQQMMADKLGLEVIPGLDDEQLIRNLDSLLSSLKIDMTLFYRLLAQYPQRHSTTKQLSFFKPTFYKELSQTEESRLKEWLLSYEQRLKQNKRLMTHSTQIMNKTNPQFTLRNYHLQSAIEDIEKGSRKYLTRLEESIQHPYTEIKEFQDLYKKKPDWASNKAGCSMLSCSS